MSNKQFVVVGGKVRRVDPTSPLAMSRCTDCRLKDKEIQDLKARLHDQDKKVKGLIGRIQEMELRKEDKRESHTVADIERRHAKVCIVDFSRKLGQHLRYMRIVLWLVYNLYRHPPGGFCVLCAQPDGEHDVHCALGKIFDKPSEVVLDHKDAEIDEGLLSIPHELRVAQVEAMVQQPWGLYSDLSKQCHDHACGQPPLKGKLFCAHHMPKGYY